MLLYTDIIFTEDYDVFYSICLTPIDYSDVFKDGELEWSYQDDQY